MPTDALHAQYDDAPLAALGTPSLAAVLADAWRRLADGAASGKAGFHLPVLATAAAPGDAGGGSVDARTVVLRAADADSRTLTCHTDARSPKAAALSAHPAAAWVFYDPEARLQLRARGPTTVHHADALADERWADAPATSRRCYLAPRPPGVPTDRPDPNLPPAVEHRVPELAETEPGRPHFAVLRTRVDRLDWLALHHAGHRRAVFTWSAGGELAARWAAV